jgi:hypothetical protein
MQVEDWNQDGYKQFSICIFQFSIFNSSFRGYLPSSHFGNSVRAFILLICSVCRDSCPPAINIH